MKRKLQSASLLISMCILIASCKKEDIMITPIAIAGDVQNIQLPTNNATLRGVGTTKNGSIVGYFWTLVSGPNVPIVKSPSSPITVVSGLVAGKYLFQFAVIDNLGLTGIDTVSLVVNPSLAKCIAIQPNKNPFEGYFDIYYPDRWFTNIELPIGAWTAYGSPETYRDCIKFDYSAIPSGSIIDSATLYLYAMPTPLGGTITDAHYGPNNACYIQRITSTWTNIVNPFTWNSQPNFTTDNKAIIPQSTSGSQNDVVDVTAIVKDMFPNNNNGFIITLQNESTYNIRQYASSNYTDSTKHPKIIIKYH